MSEHSEDRPVNLREATVPIISVIAVVGALIGGVLWIQNSIASESKSLRASIESVADDVQNLREKVVSIDASRFSASDGLDVWKQIATVKETLVRIEQRQADVMERLKLAEKKP